MPYNLQDFVCDIIAGKTADSIGYPALIERMRIFVESQYPHPDALVVSQTLQAKMGGQDSFAGIPLFVVSDNAATFVTHGDAGRLGLDNIMLTWGGAALKAVERSRIFDDNQSHRNGRNSSQDS